jgi:hypothetical protein
MDTFLTEWTQVYMNGALPPKEEMFGTDNLDQIVIALMKTNKMPNQIFSILRGMGIAADMSYNAVCKHTSSMGLGNDCNPPVIKTKKNNQIMTQLSTLPLLAAKIVVLREELSSLSGVNTTNFSYNTKNALDILEKYSKEIEKVGLENITILETSIENKKNHLKTIEKVLEDYSKDENGNDIVNDLNKYVGDKASLDLLKSDISVLEQTLISVSKKQSFKHLIGLVNELNQFNWLLPVGNFIKESKSYLQSNIFTVKVLEALNVMGSDKYSNVYEKAIQELESMFKKEEDAISNEIAPVLEKFKWIPSCHNLLNEINNYRKIVNSTKEGNVNKVYSPIQINEDTSMTFAVTGNYYVLRGNEIVSVDESSKPDGRFLLLEKALKTFKINENVFTLYNNNKEIVVDLNEGVVKIDSVVVDHSDVETFRNVMLGTGTIGLNEKYKLDSICHLIELSENIKELDIVTSISSNKVDGLVVNIIKLNENVYVNTINPVMGINTFDKVENANEVLETVKSLVNVDITNLLFEKLDSEKKDLIIREKKKEQIENSIKLLESKLKELHVLSAELDNSESIQEAIKLVQDEIEKKDKELQESWFGFDFGKKKNKEAEDYLDKGYIEGVLNANVATYKKDTLVYVNAEEYSSSGNSEVISIILKVEGKPDYQGKVEKKYITLK